MVQTKEEKKLPASSLGKHIKPSIAHDVISLELAPYPRHELFIRSYSFEIHYRAPFCPRRGACVRNHFVRDCARSKVYVCVL
ncbi:hypothetical protein EVAR_38306_1 [Eumeta japonica]|uniref:Uncharacterized protein n=1 Tax=Eumeta variegata TaxID=151549 RepID=A0A4C1WAN1_EUMVA|nr:hypothetical protein EVAR_38306_1 [Eumeta japonica]